MDFGISTHLLHDARLAAEHLEAIASSGFPSIELFALRSHFDYGDAGSARDLGAWLRAAGLRLHSVHAPIAETLHQGVWGPALSNAARDPRRRATSLEETTRALGIADIVPYSTLVVHLGVPDEYAQPGDNDGDAARRSIEELHRAAAARGVTLALEVIPNALSRPEALMTLIDDVLELDDVGICLDVGHAHLLGDAVEAIETVAGRLVTTHVHDNGGRRDEHLLPYQGTVDWPAVMMAFEKVGYGGVLMLELASTRDLPETLQRTRQACARLEALGDTPAFDAPSPE